MWVREGIRTRRSVEVFGGSDRGGGGCNMLIDNIFHVLSFL